MTKRKTAAVILAAGLGTRMESALPKVMHPLAGRPMINHVLSTLESLAAERVVVVVGEDMKGVAEAVAPHTIAVQHRRLGTAHAVLAAREALRDFDGDVLVLYGDTPLIAPETLESMRDARASAAEPDVVVLGFRPGDPGQYGRLITGPEGDLERIVEAKDASRDELNVDLCNSGVMVINGARMFGWLERIGNDNAKGEYYLTDIVALARGDDCRCAVVEGNEDELLGVNSRGELAVAEALVQTRLRARAMASGVTLVDPATVYFCDDTRFGRDVLIEPHVVFGPGVALGDNVTIRAFSHIEGAKIAPGAGVGPFARLRPGAEIGEGARIGNFVEVKKSTVEEGAKVNHLAYIGDARIGAGANIGAGTITCNYDGFFKFPTDIGKGAFIGSNTALVAPVKVGDGAVVGAGSVVTKDVAADALAVTRAPRTEAEGWAARFRERKAAEKASKKKKV